MRFIAIIGITAFILTIGHLWIESLYERFKSAKMRVFLNILSLPIYVPLLAVTMLFMMIVLLITKPYIYFRNLCGH